MNEESDTAASLGMRPVCHCSGTTEAKIRALFNQGLNDLEAISRQTGAAAGCGACETEIQDLLNAWGSEAR